MQSILSALATIGGGLLLAALAILGFRWLFEGWKL